MQHVYPKDDSIWKTEETINQSEKHNPKQKGTDLNSHFTKGIQIASKHLKMFSTLLIIGERDKTIYPLEQKRSKIPSVGEYVELKLSDITDRM